MEPQQGHARRRPLTGARRTDPSPPPQHSAPRDPAEGTRVRPPDQPSRRVPLVISVGAASLLLVGILGVQLLGDDTPEATDLAASTRDSAATPPAAASPAPSAAPPVRPRTVLPLVTAATAANRTPATAQAALTQLMAGRALVTTRLLRATVRDDAVVVAAAGGVLAGTAEDLATVARAYGGNALATELGERLDAQAAAALTYAEAARNDDAAAAARATSELEQRSAALGVTYERATGGALKGAATRADATQLIAYVDAQSRGDHATGYRLEQGLQVRSASYGATLAARMAGPIAPGTTTPQQQALSARWQLLFGQHSVLAGDVVRAGLTGADDFPAATAALDANTQALTDAVAGVVVAGSATTFSTLWADQIDSVIAYTRAGVQTDRAGQRAATARLTASGRALTTFFSEATGGRLTAASLGPAFERHTGALMRQADAWAESDAASAYALAAADYAGLAGLAAPAASAFTQTIAARVPVGGAATGWGGAAAVVGPA